MAPQRKALATTVVAFVFIIAAVAGGLGAEAFISNNSSHSVIYHNHRVTTRNCQQYSCVQVYINSNSPISGISVSLVPEPAACTHVPPVCDPVGTNCNLPSNFCANINTRENATVFTFQGIKQGYYWLGFNANVGVNASRGTVETIHVLNQTVYYVMANITAGLATSEISITNSTLANQ